MSVCASADYGNLENNENLSINVQWCIEEQKNVTGSQEIFSDDDHVVNISCDSPRLSVRNDIFNSSIISIKTPTICSRANEETPGRAAVPRTPADLLPYIKKTSFLWTSDMETPQSKISDQSKNCDRTFNSTDTINKTPTIPKTPPQLKMEINPKDVTSPVLGGKKRAKRKVKRRILNNINLDFDNNNDRQSNAGSDKVPSETTSSASSEVAFEIHKEIDNCAIKESNNLDCRENKLLEEAVNTEKNSNTSTQDFFSNASFSSIDKLCSTAVIQEENVKPDINSNQLQSSSKQVDLENKENNVSKNVSNDVLEKVAAIRKNQKPMRRSTDISHTVIPKEVFAKSVMELELADAKFSQEKKNVVNKAKSLALMSFSQLSSLNGDVKSENSNGGVNSVSAVTNNVPVSVVDNKNINCGEQAKKDQCSLSLNYATNKKISVYSSKFRKSIGQKESTEKINSDKKSTESNEKFSNQKGKGTFDNQSVDSFTSDNKNQITDGFSTAKGRDIPINEDKLRSYEKIYQELEKEIPDEDVPFDSKQKKVQPKKLSTNFGRQTLKEDKKTDKLKLYQDLELQEFLEPKGLQEDMNDAGSGGGGFQTGRGSKISISKEKEKQYMKIYNELSDDVDFSAAKQPNAPKASIPLVTQRAKSNMNSLKSSTSSVVFSSDGFSTARGGTVPISEEKEKLYAKIYNELSDDIDFDTAKKSKVTNPAIKPLAMSSTSKISHFSSSRASSNGFETARGGGISISNEKEQQYMRIYNELNDIDEDSLLNIKTNKSKSGLSVKPKEKVVLSFKKPSTSFSVRNIALPSAKSSSDGFATAKGTDIPISNDKESYYIKIYNELSDEIPGDSSKDRPREKPIVTPKIIKKESLVIKKEIENVNEVLEEFGDLAEFFSPPHQTNTEDIDGDKNFIVPNSSNIIQKNDQLTNATTVQQMAIKKEVLDHDEAANSNGISALIGGKPVKNVIGLLKRKLDDCDPKRTGRCRSFGGFPADGEAVNAAKLNKSDPHNESSANQPLQKCLSVSQCFDAHSDSWLSKVEISYLNSSKVNSPQVKKQKKDNVTASSSKSFGDCSGFSAQEELQSHRLCSSFRTFLRKKRKKYDNGKALEVEAGHSITLKIKNQTSSKCHLFLQYENNVDLKKTTGESNFVLVEAAPKIIEIKKVETNIAAVEIGKRKHVDTDSDTPLTSVKKPRVGSELQGRKLFSDESDDEERKEAQRVASDNSTQPVQSMETQELEVEAEEEEVDLSEERMSATLLQEKTIRNKKRLRIKPTVGTLLSERLANSQNRTTWSQLVGSSLPKPCSTEQIKQNHCDPKILDVTASNATCYTFLSSDVTGRKNVVSLDVSDGAVLIFDKNGRAGVSEFSQAFLAMPGVDPKLLPAGWIENHYKWIVWKLAALDRVQFDSKQLSKNLTPQRVMSELKYRYDREIDKAQRPALRRILEKDDVATRRMVLCISSIKECAVAEETDKEVRTMLGLPRWKVEATDGWYDIPLTVDSAMANYISTGKIKEGTKIITYGAELMECERGFFPLEKPPNVSLKIHTNCTRRAKWDSKLGYQKNSRPLPVKLRDIISAGGMIGEITAAAARVYPVLYREKTADGKSIYRNARSEEKAAIAHERAVEKQVDAMYAEAQKNFDSKKKSDSDEDFETSQTQISLKLNHYERKQEEFKRKLESQVRKGLPPKRDVTTVLKVRLVDGATTVILSIWGAGDESNCDIREGDTVSVYNCFASGHRGGDLHLTASRFTHIKTEPLLKLPYPNRICSLIPDIGVVGFEPKFGEFDTVGVVVSSGSAPYGMKNFEMVNLAYPKPDDSGSSYLSVLFWNGVASFGFQGMFTPGSFVACSNLEWRRNLWSIAVAYCSEKSMFTGNPRQVHLMKELRNLKALVQHPASYAESCVEEVAAELAKKPQPRSSQGTPTSWPTDRCVSFASPADNFSPGNATLQKRLDKLSRYGSSPEISPIVLSSSSTRINKDFTPVARRKT